jgi:hypothetical protein
MITEQEERERKGRKKERKKLTYILSSLSLHRQSEPRGRRERSGRVCLAVKAWAATEWAAKAWAATEWAAKAWAARAWAARAERERESVRKE